MNDQIERRFTPGHVELRTVNGKPRIMGYAAIFNSRSENLGGFVEIIAPGAFDGVLGDDVRALFNHDPNLILGRTRSGTCSLRVDATGLAYEIDPPDTQTARDLLESLRRGDVDQSSFAFSVKGEGSQEWSNAPVAVRTIKRISRLYDVSPVTYPAYLDTSAAQRELQRALGRQHGVGMGDDAAKRQRDFDLAEAESNGALYDPSLSPEANRRAIELHTAELG